MHNRIVVRLTVDRPGCARLKYAADLASRLKLELVILAPTDSVVLPGILSESHSEIPFLKELLNRSPGLKAEVLTANWRSLKGWLAASEDSMAVTGLEDDWFFQSVPRVYSADETQTCRDQSRIVMPIGERMPPLSLIEAVKSMAGRMRVPVDIYHTTWPDPAKDMSDEPLLHMSPEASSGAIALMSYMLPIEVNLVVEMAQAVSVGIHQYALRSGCCLIAMAPGEKVVRGSYAAEIVSRSTVPVLFVPREANQ